MEIEIVTISKNVLNCEFDQNLYCFKQIVFNKNLKFLFVTSGYFVYHNQFNYNLSNSLSIVRNYVNYYFCSL